MMYGDCNKCGLNIDEERNERILEHPFLESENHFLRRKMDKMHNTGLCLMCYEDEYGHYSRQEAFKGLQ